MGPYPEPVMDVVELTGAQRALQSVRSSAAALPTNNRPQLPHPVTPQAATADSANLVTELGL